MSLSCSKLSRASPSSSESKPNPYLGFQGLIWPHYLSSPTSRPCHHGWATPASSLVLTHPGPQPLLFPVPGMLSPQLLAWLLPSGHPGLQGDCLSSASDSSAPRGFAPLRGVTCQLPVCVCLCPLSPLDSQLLGDRDWVCLPYTVSSAPSTVPGSAQALKYLLDEGMNNCHCFVR